MVRRILEISADGTLETVILETVNGMEMMGAKKRYSSVGGGPWPLAINCLAFETWPWLLLPLASYSINFSFFLLLRTVWRIVGEEEIFLYPSRFSWLV